MNLLALKLCSFSSCAPKAIWYTILGGMLPAAVSVSLLQWRHGELPEPMLDYFETPSSYSLRFDLTFL